MQGFLIAKEAEECSPRTTEYNRDRLTRFAAFLNGKGHSLEVMAFTTAICWLWTAGVKDYVVRQGDELCARHLHKTTAKCG